MFSLICTLLFIHLFSGISCICCHLHSGAYALSLGNTAQLTKGQFRPGDFLLAMPWNFICHQMQQLTVCRAERDQEF